MEIDLKESIKLQSASLNCFNCGRRFGCGHEDNSCWCQQAPVIEKEKLQSHQGCLCPECLVNLSTHQGSA